MSTCWADPLNRTERRVMAAALANACKHSWEAAAPYRAGIVRGSLSGALAQTSAEMADLRIDVTERAEVPAS